MAGNIHYYCSNRHCYALGIFAAYWAKEIAPFLRIVPYSHVPTIPAFEPGIHIFTDFDRLPARTRQFLPGMADGLAAAGNRVLNHPGKVKMRFELLRAMHEAGINDFNAYRLVDWRRAGRYPVFIRHADGHSKPLSDLLDGPEALEKAAAPLLVERGDDPDLIVVEFGNARDRDGRFRKYSAFRVAANHYASSLQANEHWWVKYSDQESAADKAAQATFAMTNPHREQLLAAWEVSGADYGRMDYCVVNGRVQIFEVNSNPTIAFLPGEGTRDHGHYAEAHEAALTMLLQSHQGGEEVPNPVHRPAAGCFSAAQIHAAVIAHGKRYWKGNWPSRPAAAAKPIEPELRTTAAS